MGAGKKKKKEEEEGMCIHEGNIIIHWLLLK